MTERYIEFLVDATGKAPRNLKESIRRVRDASAGFRQSWLIGDKQEAYETSQEAFEHLDYIQNELLRQRDVLKMNASWQSSPFKSALALSVGNLINDASLSDRAWFVGLKQGVGAMPANASAVGLSLETALNKLKHRDTIALNFFLPPSGDHILYIYTHGGMGKSDSISEINILAFCSACKTAAQHI